MKAVSSIFFWAGLALVILAYLTKPNVCKAEPRNVDLFVTNIHGPYSPEPRVAKDLLRAATIYIRAQTSANIRVKRWRTYEGANLPYSSIGTIFPLAPYRKIFKKENAPNNIMSLVIIPPFFDPTDGGVAIYGEAHVCSIPGPGGEAGGAFVAIADRSPSGFDFLQHSFAALTHELGHLIGAFHDDSEHINVMHSALLNYIPLPYNLEFSARSKRQIRRCFFDTSGRAR